MSARNIQEVISGRMDIGPLWLRVPEAIRGEVRIDPSAYTRLTYGYHGGASDNWDEVAAALDLLNLRLGQAATTNLAVVTEFLRTKVADRRFMQKEFGSRIYLELHFQPTVLQFAEVRKRGNAELAAGLRAWLRALGGYLAWTGCWGPGKTWTRAVAITGPGARLLVGAGAFNPRIGGTTDCVFGGKRSFDFNDDWNENVFAPVILSDLCFGIRGRQGDIWRSHNRFIEAVETAYGQLEIFTPQEHQRLLAATRNDIDALEWCRVELIGDWLPIEQNTFIRSERGVAQVMHRANKAPTAPTYCTGWNDDGTTYAAGADNGLRGAHGEQIEDGHAEIDLAARTGWCQRASGPDRVRVGFPLPKGNLVAVLDAQYGIGARARYYRSGVEISAGAPVPSAPAPEPQPGPTSPGEPRRHGGCAFAFVAAAAGLAWWLV